MNSRESRSVYTGFHIIEEKIKRLAEDSSDALNSAEIIYAKPAGPRVKKILEQANLLHISCREVMLSELDALAAHLPGAAKEHRGIMLRITTPERENKNNFFATDIDDFIAQSKDDTHELVVILDSITDPHNIGAIIRSACQFGASLVILPKNNSVKDVQTNDVVARTSVGAVEWMPVAVTANLVSAAQKLKKAGFWLYCADARGDAVFHTQFALKTAIVLGSEGAGISRLLAKECDSAVSIPMCGKIDSLNVSVAAGILFYEIFRQTSCADMAKEHA